jgi:hypothetical protein
MRVLRGLWLLLVGIKDALVLILLLLFFAMLYMALTIRPNPTVSGSGALVLRLDGAIVEQPQDANPFAILSGDTPQRANIGCAMSCALLQQRGDRRPDQGGRARSRQLHRRRPGGDRRGRRRGRSGAPGPEAGAGLCHRL